MPTLKYPLILGSASPVRAEILRSVKLEFTVMVSPFDEESMKSEIAAYSPLEQAIFLAKGKAQSININDNSLILSADQVCECEGNILSKPGNRDNASSQLSYLSGKTHYQHSALCLMQKGDVVWEHHETASLKMRELTNSEIEKYIALDKPYGSCGSYMLEKHGKHLFSKINGSEDVIKGLPAIALLNFLYQKEWLVI